MSLLGDEIVELFLRDNAVAVNVSTLDHGLQHLIVGELSQILGNLPQLLESDES